MDRVVHAHSRDGLFRIVAVSASATVEEACRRHDLHGVARLAISRAIVSTALVGSVEKGGGRFSAQWGGRGPLGNIHVDLRPGGALRGYVSGHAAEGALAEAVGPGLLVVVRQEDSGPFTQSQVPLDSHEIDTDMEAFLDRSDQVPSVLRTFVEQGGADGVLVQTLPGGDADAFLPGAGRLAEAFFNRSLPRGEDPRVMITLAAPGFDWVVVDESSLAFRCTCSHERVLDGVLMLGWDEIAGMVDQGLGTSVRCEFCATDWVIGVDDLIGLLIRAVPPVDEVSA